MTRKAKSASEAAGEDFVAVSSADHTMPGDGAASNRTRREFGPLCPLCGTRLEERMFAQVCPRPNCHTVLGIEGTGRPRVGQERPLAPCVDCGAETPDRYLAGDVTMGGGIGTELFHVAWRVPRCAGCELRRGIAKARAVAANEAVYPEVRERMRKYLNTQEHAA